MAGRDEQDIGSDGGDKGGDGEDETERREEDKGKEQVLRVVRVQQDAERARWRVVGELTKS